MYEILKDGTIITFDGEKKDSIEKEKLDDMKNNIHNYEHLVVHKNFIKELNKEKIEDCYNKYIIMANKIKTSKYITKNRGINFFRCPSIKQNALNYFYSFTT